MTAKNMDKIRYFSKNKLELSWQTATQMKAGNIMISQKKIFMITLLVLTMLFSSGILLLEGEARESNKNLTSIDKAKVDNEDEKTNSDNTSINILLLGLDSGGFRSDVIMLLNYEPVSGNLMFFSIPRDTMVKYKGKFEKINALYSNGKEDLIKNTIENLTGLDIEYYITADFIGFRKIVDSLGGVYLNVPINMDYDDPEQALAIHIKKGPQLLNGKKAEEFVRYRRSDTGSGKEIGDLGRIEMQFYFMKEMINQKIDLKYIDKADEVFTIVRKNVRTNISLSVINKYLPYATKVSKEGIKSFTAPGEPKLVNDIWYYIVDTDKTFNMIRQNFALL